MTTVAIFVFADNLGGNLFTATADQTVIGSDTVNAPVAGNSGKFADISHIDFFVQPAGGGNSVPDSGTTAMLLGSVHWPGTSALLGNINSPSVELQVRQVRR